jgi:MoxR-like ATPase
MSSIQETTPGGTLRADHDPGHATHEAAVESLRASLNLALCGKGKVMEYVLACLLARGHLLLEDLPGLGKTTLAKALAHAIGGRFARIQCTPDLLPGDITGFNMFNQSTREFEFVAGPVFSDVVLTDEINRATPRTQSALFEAMAERQVTVDNVCRKLSDTFLVIATQNPVESHGTYPLPEAQLDRFAMKLSIGYPDRQSELKMLADDLGDQDDEAAPPTAVISRKQLRALQKHVARIAIGEAARAYIVDLTRATRQHAAVAIGLSPRGMLVWQRVSQAWAYLQGRDFVIPDDVQNVAPAVLGVRLPCQGDAASHVVADIVKSVVVPV